MYIMEDVESCCIQDNLLTPPPPPSICKFNLRIRSNTDISMNRLQYNEKERSKSVNGCY